MNFPPWDAREALEIKTRLNFCCRADGKLL